MMRTLTKTLTATVLFSAGAACAPVSTADSHPDLSLDHIEPYTAEFDYFVAGDDDSSERAGHWTDSLGISDGLVVRKVRRYDLDGQADLVRTVVADRQTLPPVRIQQRFGPGLSSVYQLEFTGQDMTQVLIGNALTPARVASTTLAEPVVETGLQAVFAMALPLRANGEVEVTSYVPGAEPKVLPKTFHIVGQETLNVMDQELTAWRIEDRAAQWTYWVRKEKPYLVRVSHPMPDGRMSTSFLTRFDVSGSE